MGLSRIKIFPNVSREYIHVLVRLPDDLLNLGPFRVVDRGLKVEVYSMSGQLIHIQDMGERNGLSSNL